MFMNPPSPTSSACMAIDVAIVGGGPAGLMAAEVLSAAGLQVDLFDAMPSVGRKFLLAGKGGLNLTHSEASEVFVRRYGAQQPAVQAWLQRLDAKGVQDWAQGLGVDTFVGTSGRVFPRDMKAAPLLRAWLKRLKSPQAGQAVRFHMRHRWSGCDNGDLLFESPEHSPLRITAKAMVLALGGASWPRLGSDGAWVPWLQNQGVAVRQLRPANCGFDVTGSEGRGWSRHFTDRFAGQPFKSVALRWLSHGQPVQRRGEFVLTATGIEGSLVYAASADLRDQLAQTQSTCVWLDLLPDRTPAQVLQAVSHPRGSRSLTSHLKSRIGLDGIKVAVLHELLTRDQMHDPVVLASFIKAVPIGLARPRPIEEAISTAGGVDLCALDEHLMVRSHPGVFCAGEMLDWEAPTGGYLLTAALASGRVAAEGLLAWWNRSP
jgi:uncharacterized flavoprotein (TIGR03862 family)